MAKFNAPKRLIVEDFPAEQRAWIGKLFDPLNVFMEQVTRALTNGAVITDNFKAKVFDISISAAQTWPMVQNISDLKTRPSSVSVGYIAANDETDIVDAFSLAWSYNNGTLYYRIVGLDTGKAYKAKIIVLV